MSALLPVNSIVWWPGTAASIPAGFSRATAFDGRFFQGSTTAGTDAGGVHTHTGVAHSHTSNSHAHTLTVSGTASGSQNAAAGSEYVATHAHGHSSANTTASFPSINSTAITVNSTAATPAYLEVIAIGPTSSEQAFPSSALAFFWGESAPTGFAAYASANQRYLRGAPAGGDGGATGGTSTHSHTTVGHSHTTTSHNHGGSSLFGVSDNLTPVQTVGAATAVHSVHHEARSISSQSPGTSTSSPGTSTESNDPEYMEMPVVQKTGVSGLPFGLIVGFTGAPGDIPSDWLACNGSAGTPDISTRQIRATTTFSARGSTGGANNHTHTGNSHTHTGNSHTHTFSVSVTDIIDIVLSGLGAAVSTTSHSHTSYSMSSDTWTMSSDTWTMSSADKRDAYRTLIYIMYVGAPVHIRGSTLISGSSKIAS